ncbi:hypothetical protein EXS71_00855 [Candidatus Uhrbacteria bacterium]|nr:hypothetical protein [Candidatus Uhrbacteria bacterium]
MKEKIGQMGDPGQPKPEAEKNPFPRLFAIAKETEAAKTGLLRPEHIAYCMAWKEKVNKESKPFSLIYGAIGADISTPLFTTNATEIHGIDSSQIHLKRLRDYLSGWKEVDQPTKRFKMLEEPAGGRAEEDVFTEDMMKRRDWGFYNVQTFFSFSRERCAVIELKKLGVQEESIHVSLQGKQTSIDFAWAFPGEKLKPRKIIFYKTNLAHLDEFDQLPAADCYYQKSADAMSSDLLESLSAHLLSKRLHEHGLIMMGLALGGSYMVDRKAMVKAFRENFITPKTCSLTLPSIFLTQMLRSAKAEDKSRAEEIQKIYHYGSRPDLVSYGWHLGVVQKLD